MGYLPARHLELWRLASAPDVDLRKVAVHLGTVPEVAAATIRYANSAYVGSAFPVGTILGSVVRVGSRSVAALALASASRNLMAGWGGKQAWEEALAVGRAARILGRLLGVAQEDSEMLFVAGLFTGVGALHLSHRDSGYLLWRRRLINRGESSADILKKEEMIYGSNHAAVAGRVLTEWGFPTKVAVAIASHHDGGISDFDRVLPVAIRVLDEKSEIAACMDGDLAWALSELELDEHAAFVRSEALLFADAASAAFAPESDRSFEPAVS